MASDSERLEIDITARDDASATIDKLTKKVDALEKDETTVEVDADTGDAESEVQSFARKLEGLTKSDQVVLLAVKAGQAQTELRGLATDIARLDTSDPTVDVKLEQYAQTSAQLDDLEGKIKAIGDADPTAGGHLEEARTKLQGLGEEAGNTQGAVHSMAGNAIGDFAATTSGVGPLGEAIGQLTEIAVAGEGSLKQLAVAGLGLGAISAGILVLNTIMGHFAEAAAHAAEIKAFNKKQVDDYTTSVLEAKKALDELNGVTLPDPVPHGVNANMADLSAKTNELVALWEKAGKIEGFDPQADKIVDLTHTLVQAGITAADFAKGVVDGGVAINELGTKARAAGLETDTVREIIRIATEENTKYNASMAAAADTTFLFGQKAADAGSSQAALNAESARYTAQARAYGAAVGVSAEGLADFQRAVDSVDFKNASLDGAIAGMSRFTDGQFALKNIAADSEAAFDTLAASVKENGKTWDVATEKGRANQAALEDVARTLDTKLAAAYKDSGGDIDTFKRKAGDLATDTLGRLQKELGLSDDEVNELSDSLGLVPEDIETRYKLSGDEEAKAKLGLLQTSIDQLPKDVQATVTQQIITGDYVGAVSTVQSYFTGHPPTISTEIDPPPQKDIDAVMGSLRRFFGANPVKVTTSLGSFTGGLGSVGGGGQPLTVNNYLAAPTAARTLAATQARHARINGR